MTVTPPDTDGTQKSWVLFRVSSESFIVFPPSLLRRTPQDRSHSHPGRQNPGFPSISPPEVPFPVGPLSDPTEDRPSPTVRVVSRGHEEGPGTLTLRRGTCGDFRTVGCPVQDRVGRSQVNSESGRGGKETLRCRVPWILHVRNHDESVRD